MGLRPGSDVFEVLEEIGMGFVGFRITAWVCAGFGEDVRVGLQDFGVGALLGGFGVVDGVWVGLGSRFAEMDMGWVFSFGAGKLRGLGMGMVLSTG